MESLAARFRACCCARCGATGTGGPVERLLTDDPNFLRRSREARRQRRQWLGALSGGLGIEPHLHSRRRDVPVEYIGPHGEHWTVLPSCVMHSRLNFGEGDSACAWNKHGPRRATRGDFRGAQIRH